MDSKESPIRYPVAEGLSVFALVIYIDGPLGIFLDDLRRELTPAYNPHAHVSVLPPRALPADHRDAAEQARSLAESVEAFDVELTDIEIFTATAVTFIEVGRGAAELKKMHAALNQGPLAFDEPFQYHPHITLAQEIPRGEVPRIHELARKRWREYTGSRGFRAERITFVQNTLGNCWTDLAEYSLGKIPAKK